MSKRGKGERCHHCFRVLEATGSVSSLEATRDHFPIPKWDGGRETVWCCRLCNTIKGGMTAQEWACFMAETPRWWIRRQFKRTAMSPTQKAAISNLDRASEALARFRAKELERAKARRPSDDDPRWATGYYTPVSPDDPVPGPHVTRYP